MYKTLFNQRKALVFKQFTHKGWSLFACLGRVVVISVLSASTLRNATAASRHVSTDEEPADTVRIDKELTVDDIEVTASRAPLALGQAARMVTVLTRDDIQAAPVQSVNDLLKYAAGVDVRQRGPIGAQTDVSIRGGTQEQMTILLNGINICDPQTGHNAFDFPCDISDIERIEILEGPAARIYGTSSLMGAVNIVTKTHPTSSAGEEQIVIRTEGGSFGYLSAAASISKLSTLNSKLSSCFTRSDGYSRSESGNLNSDYSGFKAFYQGYYSSHSGETGRGLYWHAGLSTKGFGSNTFYSAKYDEQYERTTKLFTALQGDVDAGSFHFHPALYWNRTYDRFELIRGMEDKVPFNHHRTDVFGMNLNSWFDSPLGRTAFGAEFCNEDIVSSNLGEPLNEENGHYRYGLNRTNLSFHLEHNIMTRRFTLSAGFVAVKNTWSQMPFTLYPGIDASLRFGDYWKVYASYNESLRMPSFTELYYSVGGHKADKYLKPEELRAVECGIKFFAPMLTVKTSVFHHHQRNTIDWVMDTRDTEATWQSVNLTRINTFGFEADATLQLSSLHPSPSTLNISYCYLHQQKDELPYLQSRYSLEYLRHKLTASLQLSLASRLSMVVKYRFQDRMGSYTDTSGQVQAYHPYSVVDTRLTWQADTYSLYAEANNLFNKHYVDFGNVPQPGCWLMAGASITLSRSRDRQ
jgi:iron complex outermembrane receptor protein